ncbi:MAG TPA: DUF4194 domain-containing protein [Gammaproteobacteria bacterium]|nr:DUF4194 domain-containing protein [Gammaproteobacteria bacterium]
MTQDDEKNTNSDSRATDLLDQLRRAQSDHVPSIENDRETDRETDSSELSSLSKDEPHPQSVADFENGKMPPQARRALVSLLKYGVVLAVQKARLFEVVCQYQSTIRSHLADVYFKLVLDEKTGVAFIAQVDESDDEEDTDTVSLITRRTLSLYDTLLLLVLRKHYQERENSGEQRIIIDIERIEANLTPFLPLTNSMKSDRRKLIAALKKMLEKRILSIIRGSSDRFEITPIIRYVVSAAFLEKMLDEYQRLAGEAGLTMNLQHDNQQAHLTDVQEDANE